MSADDQATLGDPIGQRPAPGAKQKSWTDLGRGQKRRTLGFPGLRMSEPRERRDLRPRPDKGDELPDEIESVVPMSQGTERPHPIRVRPQAQSGYCEAGMRTGRSHYARGRTGPPGRNPYSRKMRCVGVVNVWILTGRQASPRAIYPESSSSSLTRVVSCSGRNFRDWLERWRVANMLTPCPPPRFPRSHT